MQTVHVTINNERAYLTDYREGMYQTLQDHWSFYPEKFRWAPAYKLWLWKKAKAEQKKARTGEDYDINSLPGWNGKLKILKDGSLPAGFFRAVWRDTEQELGIRFKITRDLPVAKEFRRGLPVNQDEKYRYQDECVDAMCKAFRRGGGIVLSATGTGKTALTAKFFSRMPYRCLFVVDQLDLLYQTKKEMESWLNEEVGMVGDSEFEIQRVTVATRQTLGRHLKDRVYRKWFDSVRVLVVDELHEQMGKTNFEILEKVKPIARYGLTATLQMGQKHVRARAWMFAGPVIFEFPLSEGVESGVLTESKVLQLRFPARALWGRNDTYQEEYEEEVVFNTDKQDSLEAIVRYLVGRGKHIITLVDRVKHVEVLSDTCDNIPHRLAYGKIGQEVRTRSRTKFEKGKISLIIANRVFKKGINVKIVDVMIDMAEMKSANDTQQKLGRGVRLHPDKELLIYIDVGTQGDGRMGRRTRTRANALRRLGIEVKKVDVSSPRDALRAVMRFAK